MPLQQRLFDSIWTTLSSSPLPLRRGWLSRGGPRGSPIRCRRQICVGRKAVGTAMANSGLECRRRAVLPAAGGKGGREAEIQVVAIGTCRRHKRRSAGSLCCLKAAVASSTSERLLGAESGRSGSSTRKRESRRPCDQINRSTASKTTVITDATRRKLSTVQVFIGIGKGSRKI